MENDFSKTFRLIKILAIPAGVGVTFLLIGKFAAGEGLEQPMCLFGCILGLPFFVVVYFSTILHWKARYRGYCSGLWGGLLIVDGLGFVKLLYFLAHMIPDMRRRGIYNEKDNRQQNNSGNPD